MTAIRSCRILIDPEANSGAWNMAVDEVLLESAVAGGGGSVRLYRWSEATLSLGYFQAAVPPDVAPRFRQLPVVRRLSGGGAILHHHELTYSCVVPAGHPSTADPVGLYDLVHSRIVAVLAEFGFRPALRGLGTAPCDAEFLCFARANPHDLVVDGQKVLGSAQRRRKGAVLQHGSLVLLRSEHAPQFPGLFDLAGRAARREDLSSALAPAIADAVFGAEFAAEIGAGTAGQLNAEERASASRLALRKI